jgi:nickel-dependent lactate racemase
MSVWQLKGPRSIRWDGLRVFGRPPVLAPPAWALAERVWEAIGARPEGEATIEPPESIEAMCAAIPREARRIALVVPDATRVGGWRALLPHVLEGIRRERGASSLVLLVAGGVHALSTRRDLLAHLLPGCDNPENLVEGWNVIQNGDNRFRSHRNVGSTPAGTPVRLRAEYLESDWRILLGGISYHYFAGYGGGRKLVFPGLGEPEGIAVNHRRALRLSNLREDPQDAPLDALEWEEGCRPGNLEANPVHEDLDQAACLAPPHWAATVVEEPPADPDPAVPRPFPLRVVQGPYPAALGEAAESHDLFRRIAFTCAPRLLLADAGGEPRDATFLQAHKSLQHAVRFVAPGGRVLMTAGCAQGLGSATLSRYADDPVGFRPLAGISRDPLAVIHAQTAVALRRAASAARVGLMSDLPDSTVRGLGLVPLSTEEDALAFCAEAMEAKSQAPAQWGWLPRAERFLPAEGWLGGGLLRSTRAG